MNKLLRYGESTILRHMLLVAGVILSLSFNSKASHLYGADFYYTHLSGNTYKVTLVLYGDCEGQVFNTLPSSTPKVDVFNGSSFITTLTLTVQSPSSGTEVTPVCPSQLNNTKCSNPNNP